MSVIKIELKHDQHVGILKSGTVFHNQGSYYIKLGYDNLRDLNVDPAVGGSDWEVERLASKFIDSLDVEQMIIVYNLTLNEIEIMSAVQLCRVSESATLTLT